MQESGSQIDLKDYWKILLRRKTLLIIPIITIPLIAFAISFFLPRTYVSSAIILINESNVLPTTVERELEGRQSRMFVDLRDRQISYANQITSTKFLRRLIAVLNLPLPDYIKQEVAKTKSAYPEVSETDLGEVILADNLRNSVQINFITQNLFRLGFSASNPVEAQRRAKALADIFIEESLAQELAGVRSNIAFSENQLALYRDKLKAAEDRLRDFRKQLLVSGVEEDTSGANLRQIDSAIEALDLKIKNLESERDDFRGALIAENIDISSLSLPDNIKKDNERLLATISTLTDLLTRYSWRDPKILNLNEEAREILTTTSRKISDYVDNKYSDKSAKVREAITNYLNRQVEIEFNSAKKSILDESMVQIKNRLSENPDTEITLQRLQSEVDNYKTLYDLFVSRAQYAAINQSAMKVEAEAKYVIARPASLPLAPESPNKIRLVMMAFVLAIALGVGSILMLEILDNSFKKVEEVEKQLGLKVIGTISRIDTPFASTFKRKIPIIVGAGVSFLLILLIIFLNFKMGN